MEKKRTVGCAIGVETLLAFFIANLSLDAESFDLAHLHELED
jgi:hypothetical protein